MKGSLKKEKIFLYPNIIINLLIKNKMEKIEQMKDEIRDLTWKDIPDEVFIERLMEIIGKYFQK